MPLSSCPDPCSRRSIRSRNTVQIPEGSKSQGGAAQGALGPPSGGGAYACAPQPARPGRSNGDSLVTSRVSRSRRERRRAEARFGGLEKIRPNILISCPIPRPTRLSRERLAIRPTFHEEEPNDLPGFGNFISIRSFRCRHCGHHPYLRRIRLHEGPIGSVAPTGWRALLSALEGHPPSVSEASDRHVHGGVPSDRVSMRARPGPLCAPSIPLVGPALGGKWKTRLDSITH